MIELIPNVRIVMVNTTHPGNIGAAARAMKTMGLTELVLVAPLHFPHEEATALATSAVDVLEQARVVPTLLDAIDDCALVVGTSAQSRHLPWPMLSPRELGPLVHQTRTNQPVALVFGRERDGLSNDELQLCHYHLQIPTHPSCRCLNVAAAVQVVAYEVMMAGTTGTAVAEGVSATALEHEHFFTHLEQTLTRTEFLNPKHPRLLMSRLRRLFIKARLDQNEVNILRGILTSIDKLF